jgi:hypothetical protein
VYISSATAAIEIIIVYIKILYICSIYLCLHVLLSKDKQRKGKGGGRNKNDCLYLTPPHPFIITHNTMVAPPVRFMGDHSLHIRGRSTTAVYFI